MYNDKNLACKDCQAEFVFSASEQQFYAEKGFENEPARCPQCRAEKKAQRNNRNSRPQNNSRGQRELFDVVCSECGTDTKVPFRPTGDKPVYCRDCFNK
ncbi:zinc-ribbon domain containing protein [Alkalicella caledoniensis]|uniref:Zinc-ribbon domain containing protein n=1 Tax=Alkalicella caledoniensis TaxID=2731377 RepID=A0A7G9WAP4_ALKCA|nr:zinc-ribbon domain containing protein [Alkalicella caledoniensis]QNO15756.1 zinc-ribbon domain containing protein [Alkalicella caledoniensis]